MGIIGTTTTATENISWPAQVLTGGVYTESGSYSSQLLRQGRGFPLKGVAIGDVGRVTPEGIFDFFFNIYCAPDHPINANAPEDFVPLSRHSPADVIPHEFAKGNYVSTPSVYESERGVLESFPGGEFIFNCAGPNGAVLALPDGALREKLENLEPMRQYAAKHAESWYKYVNGARGRGLTNGSLYLVTGCEKTKSWGMASFQDVAAQHEFELSFKPSTDETSGYKYRWRRGTRAQQKHADPPTEDETPPNQTTFIHAFTISLGEGLWGRLFGNVEICQLVDSQSAGRSGFVPYGSQRSPFFWALGFFGGSAAAGGKQLPLPPTHHSASPSAPQGSLHLCSRMDTLLDSVEYHRQQKSFNFLLTGRARRRARWAGCTCIPQKSCLGYCTSGDALFDGGTSTSVRSSLEIRPPLLAIDVSAGRPAASLPRGRGRRCHAGSTISVFVPPYTILRAFLALK
ncbi:hypothetical protein FB451DRAFT_1366736 [Mycena latifolia]|nr:hypothetical protein FB451DRAFT_1366736 [Mycena latifolia]